MGEAGNVNPCPLKHIQNPKYEIGYVEVVSKIKQVYFCFLRLKPMAQNKAEERETVECFHLWHLKQGQDVAAWLIADQFYKTREDGQHTHTI